MEQEQVISVPDPRIVQKIAESCNLGPLLARVLVSRGFIHPEQVEHFLRPDLKRDWIDPAKVPGLIEVAAALEGAIRAKKRILIYGDFDVDGLSATALMVRALATLGVRADYLIPNRIDEGYGFTPASFTRMLARKPEFVLTVDCGISAALEAAELARQGIQLAVTDHHEPSDAIPVGIPIADPKIDPSCPFIDLAGVGVALKLVALLGEHFEKPDLWRDLTDLAALGTMADLVPLRGENRALVVEGLRRIKDAPRPGIAALLALSHPKTRPGFLRASDLSFSLIPRLNAAGRMGDPTRALELLLCDDPLTAMHRAEELEELNQKRRAAEAALTTQALRQIEGRETRGTIVVASGEDWHEGVRGIVASRLAKRFKTPALVFSLVGDEARGSGRSTKGINLFALVESVADKVLRFGGHEGAVGITLKRADLADFTERITQAAAICAQQPESQHPLADAVISLAELTIPAVRELDYLEPCGQDNHEPHFLLPGVFLEDARAVGANRNHFSFMASDGRDRVSAIWFNCPDIDRLAEWRGVVDILCRLQVDEWNGRQRVKLMVEDVVTGDHDSHHRDEPQYSQCEDETHDPSHRDESQDSQHRDEAYDPSHRDKASLTEAFLGPGMKLHQAQAEVLDHLAQGESILTIMATGRGKSLIFQLHAAHLALVEHKVSIFVYPLRALIADQAFHLSERCKQLGVLVKSLTGETPQLERDAIFAELFAGRVHILLTTPEFLLFHGWRLEESGRIAFVVLDEAHHLATEGSDSRPAYHQAEHLRKTFPHAQFLALTATASDDEAKRIREALGITRTIIDTSMRPNLALDDARAIRDRATYLAALVARSELSLIYVNARAQAIVIAKELRERLHEQGHRIAFYHAGLPRETRLEVEAAFREGKLDALVSTSAFGEGVNLPGIRHVIHYGMPFSLIAFNQQSGRAGRDGRNATIHLLYNEQDSQVNRSLLARTHPTRDTLAILYRILRDRWTGMRPAMGFLPLDEEEVLAACRASDDSFLLDASGVRAGCVILAELGLIALSQTDAERLFELTELIGKVDLNDSSRYLEGQAAIRAFEEFQRWITCAVPTELLASLNRPIVPTSPLDGER
ncbi:MAG: single-stranded-DNA-specific exonuclease RecJ [Coriobacteriales bacterium]|nr:single-stranded-DNA-specific exonuclease RecJ [Coriobacteriales bacterium]